MAGFKRKNGGPANGGTTYTLCIQDTIGAAGGNGIK